MPKSMNIEIEGNQVRLQREQWSGNVAYISNYPGLLEEVKKYTWTYTSSGHPYLNCSKLNISLHKFVLQFLYGEEKLNEMLGKENIIEHLDNNGLNCTYENLHVLSEDMNKAKAFSIDKKSAALEASGPATIPALVTDVYYSHEMKYFQLQVFFNKNLVFNASTKRIVERVLFQYCDFDSLFIDWLYCLDCIKTEKFDVYKHHANRVYVTDAPHLVLREDEKDAAFVKREGKYYLVIRTNPEDGPVAFMNHTSFIKMTEAQEECLMRYANTLRISLLAGGSANDFTGSSVRSPAEGYAVPSSPPSSIVTASG
jgi:hypothetical protein